MEKIDYLSPDVPGELPWHDVPLVRATADSLEGYGQLVDDYRGFPLEIVTWPAQGWRVVDPGTGNEAGTTSGRFDFWWEGDVLFGRNQAVDDQYLLGWSKNPAQAKRQTEEGTDRSQVLLWHANYHPDGGQLFFPLEKKPFVVPLALPGDDLKLDDFVAFYVDGGKGLYIHPNIWHEGVFSLAERTSFYDEQGKVHARISCNIAQEFGVFLRVPLQSPA
ncbi:ureidoglycolate lyase [Chloroflexi bacterium TSY]|nr:ureidoglycolate lyase [Chloroflexi bacterium TSY]